MPGTIIVAVAQNDVMGDENKLPWHFPSDLRRFSKLTKGGSLIMGRKTYESIGRPLPGRQSIVVTSGVVGSGVEVARSLSEAVQKATKKIWFIGGRQIYEEALEFADEIDITHLPVYVQSDTAIYLPFRVIQEIADTRRWKADPPSVDHEEPTIYRQRFVRIT